MKKTQTLLRIGTVATSAALALAAAMPVFAENDAAMKPANKNTDKKVLQMQTRGIQEIERRIDGLNKLTGQVKDMKRLSENDKNAINASLQAQIDALNALKIKIGTTTDPDALKTDVKSITDSYRIYALVMPQGQIIAAADKIVSIADTVILAGTKLEKQIAEAKAAGKDTAELEKLLKDYAAKVSDAKVKAQAAVTTVAALSPDMGDNAKMKANQAALKDARASLKVAESDLRAARQDAEKIMKALRALRVKTNASSTAAVR